MTIDLTTLLIQLVINIIVNLVIISPSLWIAGRLLAGKQKAKFTDAIWIVTLGTIVFFFFNYFLAGFISGLSWLSTIISYIALLIIWLALVKHFFDCGWLKALAITIIAIILTIIVWIIIGIILVLIGIGTGFIPTGIPSFQF